MKKCVFLQVAIEFVTYWDSGFGPYNYIIFKNIIICAFGVLALIFGSKSAIDDIIKMYTSSPNAVNATIALSPQ